MTNVTPNALPDPMKLSQAISRANVWFTESSALLDRTPFNPTKRARVSLGLLHLSWEHQEGLYDLTRTGKFGSALALFRPQFEAYVRGVWFYECALDEQVDAFLSGQQPPKIGELIRALEEQRGNTDLFLSRVRAKIRTVLNDFTHGGVIQVKARNALNEIARNYNLDHIADTVDASAIIGHLAAITIAQIADAPELAIQLAALHERIYAAVLHERRERYAHALTDAKASSGLF